MRILSIFIIVVVFLCYGIPSLDLIAETPSPCCTDICATEGDENQSDTEDHTCNEICNPFSTCQCFVGFMLPTVEPGQKSERANTALVHFDLFPSWNKLILSIWNPPKS